MKKYTNEELTENIINMLKEKTKKDYFINLNTKNLFISTAFLGHSS